MDDTSDGALADLHAIISDLRHQLAEAEASEVASAEVLQVINVLPGDLAAVFATILEKAMQLCDAAFGVLWTYDGEFLRAAAHRGVPPAYAKFLQETLARPTPGSTPFRLVQGEDVVRIDDICADEENKLGHPQRLAVVELGGGRSLLAAALRKDDALLGAFIIYRQEVRPFTDKQATLLQSFAAQAVIAMENARLLTETREALEQQTATAEVLGVINSSPGDLAPVFDAMLDKAMRLCEASYGGLMVRDSERFRGVASRNLSPSLETIFREPFEPSPTGFFRRALDGLSVEHVPDLAAQPDRTAFDPRARAIVELGGARTSLNVALRTEGTVLGAFALYRREVKLFTNKQIALVENFAAQAVIAMENARLLTETREALEQQTATAEVLGVINSSPGDLAPVFDAMLEKAMRLCEANFGFLSTYDGEHFDAVALHGLPESYTDQYLAGPYLPGPNTTHDRLVQGEVAVHVPDLVADTADGLRRRAVVELLGVRSILAVPLRKDGVLLGAFHVYRREMRPFTDKQIALLQNFAAQAVIAMENARLLTETRQRTAELQESLEYQTATSEMLQVISRSVFDLQPVLDTVVETANRLCAADGAGLTIRDGDVFRYVAATATLDDHLYGELRKHAFTPDRDTMVGRVVLEGKVVHIADISVDPDYALRSIVGDIRTVLGVPLARDGVVIGTLNLTRCRVEPFTERQIELVLIFADQAVIAIENARLLTETREALDQQTATAEVLQVINSSPGDLAPVFDTLLEKTLNLCGASFGGLYTYDGERYEFGAQRGGTPEWLEFQRSSSAQPSSTTGLGKIVLGERIVHVIDLADDEAYRLRDPQRVATVELLGARAALWVALRKDERLLGAIYIYRKEARRFTDKQIALLQSFAAQAVVAIENARLMGELRQRTEEVAELNHGLEARVAEQVEELGRVGRLKRFLAPQLAEMIVSHGDEKILESHRREIVVVFCDLRGYTAFTETAEPEEVLDFLREYHGALGPLVSQFEGTLDQFSGDGIMVFFNDPVPIPDPAERAVNMAVAMREAASSLTVAWRERGRDLGFGAGIAQGYATLGQIGFSERSGYTAIGTVCNVAARLCAEAKDGQILLSQRVNVALKASVPTEQIGALSLKGLTQPVIAYNVPITSSQPALRVIEGGPPNQ